MGLQPPLPGDVGFKQEGKVEAMGPTLKDMSPGPLVWRQKALRESHSPQKPQAGEDGY